MIPLPAIAPSQKDRFIFLPIFSPNCADDEVPLSPPSATAATAVPPLFVSLVFAPPPPPHSSSSSDRLPPCHMLPLLLRLATAFRAVMGTAPRRSFGVSSSAASASAAAPHRRFGPRRRWRRPIRVGNNNEPWQHRRGLFFCLVRRLSRPIDDDERRGAPVVFEIVRMDDVPEYGAACLIACNKWDKCDIACNRMRSHATNANNAISHAIMR